MPEPMTFILCTLCFLVGGSIGHIVTKEIDNYMLHTNKPDEEPLRHDVPGRRHNYTPEEREEEPMVMNPMRRDRLFSPQPFLVGRYERDEI